MIARPRISRLIAGAAAVFALLVAPAAAGAAVPGAAVAAPAFNDGDGLHVISQQALSSRLLAVTVTTAALDRPANIRILLPSDYAAHPRQRYPVLYLLHGTSGTAADWTTMGEAAQTTYGRPLIVVMPDIALGGDGGGWCTNWWNAGAQGVPEWETFHIGQLIPWTDHNLRTIAGRGERAIAGLSQGGFCSMSYAARHPDLFGTAISFSGAPDIAFDATAQALVTPVVNATEVGLDHVALDSMFGPRQTNEINWVAHDPTALANNLRATNLMLFTGNGQPGPLDSGLPNPGAMAIEAGVHQLTQMFHDRLQSLHIPSYYDDYGPGTHSWPYWAQDLRASVDRLMFDFAHPLPLPARVTFTSADAAYAAYGWQVTINRSVRELSTLQDAFSRGFTLSGSGTATVMTPPQYVRGATYTIRIAGASTAITARAGRDRRLRISVTLGPSNTVQEFPLDGPPIGTTVYTKHITITRTST